jgi:hypothetical protein
LSLQQIDYKELAAEVYSLMKQDQDEEEEKKEEEEEEEEEKKEKEDSKDDLVISADNAHLLADAGAGEVKQDPSALQFSPEQMGVDPTDPTIPTPEDAEGMCIEAKMAKGMERGQAASECAAERQDAGPQTAPEDAKPVLVLESMNARLDSAIAVMEKLIGKDQIPERTSKEEEWKSCMDRCKQESESFDWDECNKRCTGADSVEDSKAKDTLIEFLIEKSHKAFKRDDLKEKDLCYLRALDSLLDMVYKRSKDAPSGRPPRFPKVDDSAVEKVEFTKLTVGKKNKDTGEWEDIK